MLTNLPGKCANYMAGTTRGINGAPAMCRFLASQPAAQLPDSISIACRDRAVDHLKSLCVIYTALMCYLSAIVRNWPWRSAMATAPLPRPDLFAHREALRLPAAKVVQTLVEIVGRKLTAYIGGVKDARAVDRWTAGGELYGDAEARLRFAYQVVRTLREHDSPAVVQAWLTGVNPELGDRVPLRVLRESDIDAVAPAILSAARAFLAGG